MSFVDLPIDIIKIILRIALYRCTPVKFLFASCNMLHKLLEEFTTCNLNCHNCHENAHYMYFKCCKIQIDNICCNCFKFARPMICSRCKLEFMTRMNNKKIPQLCARCYFNDKTKTVILPLGFPININYQK